MNLYALQDPVLDVMGSLVLTKNAQMHLSDWCDRKLETPKHNIIEATFDLPKYLELGDQLVPSRNRYSLMPP